MMTWVRCLRRPVTDQFDVKIPPGVDVSFAVNFEQLAAVKGFEQLADLISPENVRIRRAWVIPRAWLPKDWAQR